MSYHVLERLLSAVRNGRQRGVTLLELMAVVSILAILASVAVPTYRRYLIRSQRSGGEDRPAAAADGAGKVLHAEQFLHRQHHRSSSPDGLGLASTTETGKYTIAVVLADDGQTYDATATPAAGGGQTDDADCENFSINQRGTKGVSGPAGVQTCWR